MSRTVDENAAVGTGIGKPVDATEVNDGDVLIYSLDWTPDLRVGDGTASSDTGDARFTIDRSSGQIKVGKELNFEEVDDGDGKDEATELMADSDGGAAAVASSTTPEDAQAANNEMYILRVRATDPSGAYANVNVIVSLKDINEAPGFAKTAPKDTVTVVEKGRALLQPDDGTTTDADDDPDPLAATAFVASDQDSADTVSKYAVEGADKKLFSITQPTTDGDGNPQAGTGGVLMIVGTHTPDFEKKDSYSITITATGGAGGRRLIGSIDVTIKVTDAEDDGKVSLTQRGPQEGRVVVASLSDQDDGETITGWQWEYVELQAGGACNPSGTRTGPTGTWADIPDATSAAYTPKDFTTAGETDEVDIVGKCLRATATYTDDFKTPDDTDTDAVDESVDTATAASDGTVQTPNSANTAPKFPDQDPNITGDQSDTAMREVAENTDAGMSIGSPVTAEDKDSTDNGVLLYTLAGADEGSFGIVRSTGQLKTKAKLDYETKNEYMVMVTATDPSGASDSIMVTIMVTDGPDGAVITIASTSISYAENRMDAVAMFSATDQDGDAIDWSLGGRDMGDFVITPTGDGSSAELSFKKSPNYESPVSDAIGNLAAQNVYEVDVKATGGSKTVMVTVTDEDEDGKVTLTQYQPQVGRALSASVSDPDKPQSDERWQWSRGPSADGPWTPIDKATSASRAPAAADDGMYLQATVTYTDKFGSGKMESGVSDNAVETKTVANERPSFAAQDGDGATSGIQVSRTVEENAAAGTGIGKPVDATEVNDGDVLIYSLDWTPDLREGTGTASSDTGDARFTIDRSSGQIKVGKELNFEAADDAAENDEETTLDADPIGGAAAVATNDAGAAANNEMYILRVRATDPSGAYANVNVIVSLKDINEPPKFDKDAPKDTVTVVEKGRQLLQPDGDDGGDDPDNLADTAFVATDEDVRGTGTDDDDTISKYAVGGADKKLFSITQPAQGDAGGELTIVGTHTPDFEKKDSYSITITATGGAEARTLIGTIDVTIKVTDAEDDGKVTLTQRGPQEGRVVVASLSDQDDGETITGWQWEYVERDGTEVCNPSATQTGPTGTWADIPDATSAAYTPKDFTLADDTEVLIVGKCLRATATYTDDFKAPDDPDTADVDESASIDTATAAADGAVQTPDPANTAPKFPDQDPNITGDQSDTAMREVAENTDAGMSIGAPVTAEDKDSTDNGVLLYTLAGADEGSFGIVRSTGQLKTKAKLDYETKNEYMVMVTATDPSGASDSIMVTIMVTDGPDGATITLGPGPPPEPENTAPAFDGSSATRMVAENAAAGAYVGDPVTATDADDDSLTYSLSGSMYFDVDSETGQIMTTAMLDYEAMSSHTVTVTASDGEDSDSIDVTVMVGDMYPGCWAQGGDAANMYLNNDCEALLDSKDALGGSLNWDEAMPINDWDGIRGRAGALAGSPMRVTWLYLHGQHGGNLDGSIPAALGRLSALERLYLHRNNLTGEIPGELSELTNLVWLRLYNNDLSGEIPDLTGMDSLERLYIHENDLSGGIPATLGNLSSLTHMLLQRNDLSGEIPAMLGDMSSLVWLGLYDNMLMGGIPMELGSLSNLERLYLHGNMLSGEVPMEIGNLSALTNLWLNNNSGLSGQLPMSLDTLANLERVRISGTGFTGCIPAAVAAVENSDAAMLNLPTCQ